MNFLHPLIPFPPGKQTWIIGYELPKPIQNKQELESLFAWHNFFVKFASNADEFKDFNPRDE